MASSFCSSISNCRVLYSVSTDVECIFAPPTCWPKWSKYLFRTACRYSRLNTGVKKKKNLESQHYCVMQALPRGVNFSFKVGLLSANTDWLYKKKHLRIYHIKNTITHFKLEKKCNLQYLSMLPFLISLYQGEKQMAEIRTVTLFLSSPTPAWNTDQLGKSRRSL